MSLCKPLPSGNCKSNENATVCQHIILKNGTSVDIDLASFDKSEKLNYLDSCEILLLCFPIGIL